VSETPHVTDVEISRALNAVVVTLNDQRPPSLDRQRLQDIVTGALGGEQRLTATVAADGASALLSGDAPHGAVARIERRGDRWVGTRLGAPLSGAYIPSAG
jgi:hypothetical protein